MKRIGKWCPGTTITIVISLLCPEIFDLEFKNFPKLSPKLSPFPFHFSFRLSMNCLINWKIIISHNSLNSLHHQRITTDDCHFVWPNVGWRVRHSIYFN